MSPPALTPLLRRSLSEYVGTALLVAAVVGSGIMATRLSPDDTGLQLLENSIATGAVLLALILVLQPVSAAFNPVVTLADLATGGLGWREAAPLALAQVTGGISGAVLANLMFELDAVTISETNRTGAHLLLGEVVASAGLVLVIFGLVRSGRDQHVPYAVAAWIAAAYWFTSSTSFANPAVTVGRIFSDTFAGIAPGGVAMFVVIQLVGGAIGLALAVGLFPTEPEPQPELSALGESRA